MNRRHALAVFAGFVVLPLLAACPGGTQPAGESGDSQEPKCDFGDLIEGDKDCAVKTKAPRSSTSKRAPSGSDTKPKSKSTKK